mmetsp:Transcript_7225/g.9408  ORF Transcript_7225/g.9408 Transcript_7225/m.9408 type:complete len:529 (+) Transcript_7225:66-1652(+)|eukprot:CAMPEP_0198153556 /NCGR_PEP_ID=MMETSP1443-20131203/64746_1 /TAXON_ID=186043 /ORGANISM="Entomoneis sp., Strain CCMP2396" /LENGTH=528 /DNA_ID=CAMNT_0043819947 /DNA_START=23 /DNA_END=1609 /DNA_ORIENTATION=+
MRFWSGCGYRILALAFLVHEGERGIVQGFFPSLKKGSLRQYVGGKKLPRSGEAGSCFSSRLRRSSKSSSELPEQASETSKSLKEKTVEFKILGSISEIPKDEWNACVDCNQASSAFLDHSWFSCLEESKCASPETGWVAQHVSILVDGAKIGFVPLYIKGHSLGEFIFDNAWAKAAYQYGIDYYPKMLAAVPFTPATGSRMLWHSSVYKTYTSGEIADLRRAVALFLRKTAESNSISSVHIDFMTEEEAGDISGELKLMAEEEEEKTLKQKIKGMLNSRPRVKDDFVRRTSVQYHWHNRNANNEGKPYESFDDYLGIFKSKRRINIRRERKKVRQDEGITIDAIRGKEIFKYPGLMERMFEIYKSTIDKMYFGRQYLTLDFFHMLAKSDFVDNLCFMCARYNATQTDHEFRAEDVFAGTFNVIKDGVFYGRYWGSLAVEEVKNLHFETCYWSALEYCIENDIKRMEPGAGGGDYKWARGFDPALTHSVHYICHPGLRRAISQFVDYETEDNVQVADYLQARRKKGSAS